jgi:hypothetical protein
MKVIFYLRNVQQTQFHTKTLGDFRSEYQGFFLSFSFLAAGKQPSNARASYKTISSSKPPLPTVSRDPPLTCHFSDFPTAPVLLILLERRFISAGRQSALVFCKPNLAVGLFAIKILRLEISRELQQVLSQTVCMR